MQEQWFGLKGEGHRDLHLNVVESRLRYRKSIFSGLPIQCCNRRGQRSKGFLIRQPNDRKPRRLVDLMGPL